MREVCYEPVMREFQDYAKRMLEEVPELRGLMLVADWEVGQTDFPAGVILGRTPSPASFLGMSDQSLTMLRTLQNNFAAQLERAKAELARAQPPVPPPPAPEQPAA